MNADDVNPVPPINYTTDPVFQQFQYFMRLAFEEGYRAGNIGLTQHNEWRADWMNSTGRRFLLENGLISGKDDYK
jgi:hypothetical protein